MSQELRSGSPDEGGHFKLITNRHDTVKTRRARLGLPGSFPIHPCKFYLKPATLPDEHGFDMTETVTLFEAGSLRVIAHPTTG